MVKECCGNCDAWRRTEGSAGSCRGTLPGVIARDCPRGFWPEVDESEWCREHSLKAPEEIPPAVETSDPEEDEEPDFLKELGESPSERVMNREEQAPSKEETPPPVKELKEYSDATVPPQGPKKVSPKKSVRRYPTKKAATKRPSKKRGGK